MPSAAYPRPHRPPRYRLAAALGGGILAVLLLGSVVDLAAFRSGVALLDLAGLILVGLFAAGTWLVIRAVDHEPQQRTRHLVRAGIVLALALSLFLFGVNLLNARLNVGGVLLCIPTPASPSTCSAASTTTSASPGGWSWSPRAGARWSPPRWP